MNEFQRQLLADRLDEIGRSIVNYEKAIEKLNHQLKVKETRLHQLRDEQAQLSAGIDW